MSSGIMSYQSIVPDTEFASPSCLKMQIFFTERTYFSYRKIKSILESIFPFLFTCVHLWCSLMFVCIFTCVWMNTWSMVDAEYHLRAFPLHWLTQFLNLEFASSASLALQLVLGIPCLCLLRLRHWGDYYACPASVWVLQLETLVFTSLQ